MQTRANNIETRHILKQHIHLLGLSVADCISFLLKFIQLSGFIQETKIQAI